MLAGHRQLNAPQPGEIFSKSMFLCNEVTGSYLPDNIHGRIFIGKSTFTIFNNVDIITSVYDLPLRYSLFLENNKNKSKFNAKRICAGNSPVCMRPLSITGFLRGKASGRQYGFHLMQ